MLRTANALMQCCDTHCKYGALSTLTSDALIRFRHIPGMSGGYVQDALQVEFLISTGKSVQSDWSICSHRLDAEDRVAVVGGRSPGVKATVAALCNDPLAIHLADVN